MCKLVDIIRNTQQQILAPRLPELLWQFEANVVINHRLLGMVVIDVLQGDRIGGIELIDRLS